MRLILAGVVVAPALLLSGCMTTHTEYAADGKTVSSITKIAPTHDVVFKSGVRVQTNDGVTSAAQGIAFKALEIGGEAIARQALQSAVEATQRSSTGIPEATK